MKILTFTDTGSLSQHGARILADKIRDAAQGKDSVVLGLAGGRSVTGIYRLLAEYDLPEWKKIHFFWVDERNVPADDPESNYRLARETLLDPLLRRKRISPGNIHPLDTRSAPAVAVKTYAMSLDALGGRFDIVLLGVGEDNHIAAIFPDISYPRETAFAFTDRSPKPPRERFTATPALLSAAPVAVTVFSGIEKRAALRHFLDTSSKKTQAETVLAAIADLTILTDQKG